MFIASVTIDGTVIATRVVNGAPVTKEVPVVQRAKAAQDGQPAMEDQRKTLRLRVRVHLEPYMDEGFTIGTHGPFVGAWNGQFDFSDDNNNGVHDPGEASEPYLDLSRGVVVDPTLPLSSFYGVGDLEPNSEGDGRGRVVKISQILAELERASIGWAQAGIYVVMIDGPIVEEAPTGADGENILQNGWLDYDPAIPDDQAVIIAIGATATPDVAEVVFTGPMPGAYGYARVPANQGFALPPPFGENTYLFVGPNVNPSLKVLAHEIGHALTNLGDSFFTPYIYFPASATPVDNAPNSRRRIRHTTETTARKERERTEDGDACLTCEGNTLLIP